ncbi:hypothetical protein BJY01DRAFT_241907 [Aspergillus pseudoustus]|uniref:Protein kinase domain-containing protein n=1 Tax=Aspergillus pseudoustus TaxID=1810923 RepID=A0ABR4L232_9EURO
MATWMLLWRRNRPGSGNDSLVSLPPQLKNLISDPQKSDDWVDFLGLLCQPFFRKRARFNGHDLESHLRIEEIFLQLVTQEGQHCLIEFGPERTPLDRSANPIIDIQIHLPQFELPAARVIRTILDCHLYEVEIEGTHFICKLAGSDHASFVREIIILQKLQRYPAMQTSKLKGLIGIGTEFPGALLEKIPYETCLSGVNIEQTDVSERDRWFSRIETTIQALHAADITWGDAKAQNILIDRHSDVWIVDFGGGYTPGWVSEALEETIKGDLEGLHNLRKFLRL